jgi:hypothetical protein
MLTSHSPRLAALVLCAASSLLLSKKSFSSPPSVPSSPSSSSSSSSSPDPIAAEIARETAVLKTLPESDEFMKQVRDAAGPLLVRADEALRGGRRFVALQRLAPAFANVAAAEYVTSLPAKTRTDDAAFEAEWARRGQELSAPVGAPALRPAAVRALVEAALPQARILYDASLDYGRSSAVDAGLYYIGMGRGQLAFAAFCRTLDEASSGAEPKLRSLSPDIDALERRLLAAYVPPASLDRHPDFIAASASLKEARELDAAGLRYGALLRLLQAALRLAPPPAVPPAAGEVAEKVAAARAKFAKDGVDHSIARIFLESAEGDLETAAAKPGVAPAVAAAIVTEVLPRYVSALGPAPRPSPRPDPVATVTLVRWPYT